LSATGNRQTERAQEKSRCTLERPCSPCKGEEEPAQRRAPLKDGTYRLGLGETVKREAELGAFSLVGFFSGLEKLKGKFAVFGWKKFQAKSNFCTPSRIPTEH